MYFISLGPTIPVETATPREDDNTLTIVLVLVIPAVVQLIIALFLHCYIRSKYSSKDDNGMIKYFYMYIAIYMLFVYKMHHFYDIRSQTNHVH